MNNLLRLNNKKTPTTTNGLATRELYSAMLCGPFFPLDQFSSRAALSGVFFLINSPSFKTSTTFPSCCPLSLFQVRRFVRSMCYSEQLTVPLCLASFTFHSRFIPGSEQHLWAAGAACASHISTVSNLLCAARCPVVSLKTRHELYIENNNHLKRRSEWCCSPGNASTLPFICIPPPPLRSDSFEKY